MPYVHLRSGLGATAAPGCDPNDPTCAAGIDLSSLGPLPDAGTSYQATGTPDTAETSNVNSSLNLYSWLNSIIPQSSGSAPPVSKNPTWAFPALVLLLGVVALGQISGGRRR